LIGLASHTIVRSLPVNQRGAREMAKTKHKSFGVAERLPGRNDWISQPKARQLFGNPSPVTWWRWRQKTDFPKPKVINRRLYFLWGDLTAWWASQPERRAAA
jgi:hypothetical protein